MAEPWSPDPVPDDDATLEARRATDALFRRIASRRRRGRRRARARDLGLDLAIAVVTYTGLTIAALIGVAAAFRLLLDRWHD